MMILKKIVRDSLTADGYYCAALHRVSILGCKDCVDVLQERIAELEGALEVATKRIVRMELHLADLEDEVEALKKDE